MEAHSAELPLEKYKDDIQIIEPTRNANEALKENLKEKEDVKNYLYNISLINFCNKSQKNKKVYEESCRCWCKRDGWQGNA